MGLLATSPVRGGRPRRIAPKSPPRRPGPSPRSVHRSFFHRVQASIHGDQHLSSVIVALVPYLHVVPAFVCLVERPVGFQAPEKSAARRQGNRIPPLAFLADLLPSPSPRVSAI